MRRNRKLQIVTLTLLILGVIVSGAIIKNMDFVFQDLVEAVGNKDNTDAPKNKKPFMMKKQEWEKLEEKRLEEERLEAEKLEQERLEKERLEKERIEQERLEQERLDAEKQAELDKNKKIAYLTFDDGPSRKATPAVLDILNEYNIKATFFVVGKMIDQNPDILKRTYDEGHQIGNHSYGHDYKYLYSDAKNFMADIYKTEKLIRDVVGQEFDSKIIRFPGGSFEKRKDPMKKAANDAGYNYIDWNSLNGDAEGKKRSKSELLNRLIETSAGKDKIVVLMHDTDAKDTTVEFLRSAIDYLMKEGYEFRVLDKNYQ